MEPWPVADRVWLNRSKGPPAPFVMSTVRHGHQTGSEPRGLWRLRSVHRCRRPAQRGRGCQAFIMTTEGPPWDQDAGQHGPARRPHVTGSAGGGRRRIGLIGRANSHSKGQHVRPVLPRRGCADPVPPDGTRRQVAVLPVRANCTLRTSIRLDHHLRQAVSSVRSRPKSAGYCPDIHPSCSQSRFRIGPAKRRPSEARPTDAHERPDRR